MPSQYVRTAAKSFGLSAFLALALAGGPGCQRQALITWKSPKPLHVEDRTLLAVGDLSELNRKPSSLFDKRPAETTIGRHTFTLFAIPTMALRTHPTTPLKKSFDAAIRDALEAAGYTLVPASQAQPDAPVLRGEVNRCWWWSYSWFWPLVIDGGQSKVTLFLEDRAGNILWKQRFSGTVVAPAFGGAYGYGLYNKIALSRILRRIVRACSSAEFKAALQGQ